MFERSLHRGVYLNASVQQVAKEPSIALCSQENGVRTITLNNPKKRNALSLQMLQLIKAHLTQDVDSKELRVIVLKANGPVFSAGHDLKELTHEMGTEYISKVFDCCTEVMNLVQDIPVPVIAEVQGLATAAGCQLVASCDIAVASDKTTFATPGVSVGLFCNTPGVAVARSVPRKVALHMLFTAEPLTAHEALMHGLVSKVVPEDQLQNETRKITDKICNTSRPVVALGKRFFYRQILMSRNEAYRHGGEAMVDNLQLDDAQEGIKAFVEKRTPQWLHTTDKKQ
jgi:enoyl-CoA hydratase/carnithine racemase